MTDGCPCGTGEPYASCCGPLHDGSAPATTAEQLMRSRYSAYALGDADYLLETWDASTRPAELSLPPGIVWTRLRLLDTVAGGPDDGTGIVEFRAHFRHDGEPEFMQERSHFARDHAHHWKYRNADGPADT